MLGFQWANSWRVLQTQHWWLRDMSMAACRLCGDPLSQVQQQASCCPGYAAQPSPRPAVSS